jgi:hypothetical protein
MLRQYMTTSRSNLAYAEVAVMQKHNFQNLCEDNLIKVEIFLVYSAGGRAVTIIPKGRTPRDEFEHQQRHLLSTSTES